MTCKGENNEFVGWYNQKNDVCLLQIVTLMKRVLFLSCFWLLSYSLFAAEEEVYSVCLNDLTIDVYPQQYIDTVYSEEGELIVKLTSNEMISYDLEAIDTLLTYNPGARFTSFKFNNKFNSSLFEDIFFNIDENRLTATVGHIGKYMTPSFQTDRPATVLADGIEQASKVSRLRFDREISYSVIDSACLVLTKEKEGFVMLPNRREYTVSVDWLADNGNVPRIDINIDGGKKVTSKKTYLHAQITIDGGGVFDNMQDSVYIRGRGNDTWDGANGKKNPYRLKFDEKRKPLGMKNGKNWVLLANYMDPTLMTNSVAMKAGQMVGAAYTNHAVPVELYINGEYCGSYVFTEQVGIHNNSVDLPDNTTLLELDTYYDEENKFVSEVFKFPVNIKNPEYILSSAIRGRNTNDENEQNLQAPASTIDRYIEDFRQMETAVMEGNADLVLNIDSFVRYIFVYDVTFNMELNHPKSVYLHKTYTGTKYVFGPVWDFDWGFSYEMGGYFSQYNVPVIYPKFNSGTSWKDGSGYTFFLNVMTQEKVMKAYYRLWRNFIENDGLQEMLDYIDSYSSYANSSFQNNEEARFGNWGYSYYIANMKYWLQNRVNYIYSNLKAFEDEPDTTAAINNLKVEEYDGIKISIVNRQLVIESDRDTMLPVYRLDGTQEAVIQVRKGENLYVIIPRGTFIINRQKIRL